MVRLRVRVEEEDGGRGLLGVLELADAVLQAGDVLPQELRPGLALAIVVLARIALLGADTLLARGLGAVAPLGGVSKS